MLIGAAPELLGRGLAEILGTYPGITPRLPPLPGDGPSILAELLRDKHCTAVLDVESARMNGFAVLREARIHGYIGRVLMLTVYVSDEALRVAQELGTDVVVCKPFDPGRLAEIICDEPLPDHPTGGTAELFRYAGELLRRAGISPHLIGHRYLREAIRIATLDPVLIHALTGQLYPTVALHYGVNAPGVERNVRSAISSCWRHENQTFLYALLGYSPLTHPHRPTNGAFIAAAVEYLRARYRFEKEIKPPEHSARVDRDVFEALPSRAENEINPYRDL